MTWFYELSDLTKKMKLAPENYGAKLAGNRLYFYNSYVPKGIEINKIKFIDYTIIQASETEYYSYIIKLLDGKEIELGNVMESKEYQRLIRDLIKLNPNIILSENVSSFINRKIPAKFDTHWDFNVYSKQSRENIQQDFSSSMTIFQFKILTLGLIINFVFDAICIYLLTRSFGPKPGVPRVLSIILAAILLSISILNIYKARYKMFRGNFLTFSTLALSIALIVLSFLRF